MATGTARARVRPTALARELDRLLAEVAGLVDDVVARPHPSVESLHQLHREMRRLRHALTIWERLLPSRRRELVLPLDRRLKRLARLVGRVRDRDVVIDLLESPKLPRPTRGDAVLVARLRGRLRDDARTGRELLCVFLRSERDAHLFEGLRESLELGPRPGAGTRLATLLSKEAERRHDDVRAAHRRARRHPSSTRLHRLRIQVRRLRHLTEVRSRLDGKTHRAFSPEVRRLQSRLGRLHDLDIVLGDLDPDLRSSEWARALKKEYRSVRKSIRKSIRAHRWPDLPLAAPVGGRPGPRPRRTRS
jgi:CHAD domain-containing protein